MKSRKCPVCENEANARLEDYESTKLSATTNLPIVVRDVKVFYCSNQECGHSWLPSEEEERIDLCIERESRFNLGREEIVLARKCMGFETKSAASNFLCLNSKAFVKWENGYSAPNAAYDLLIRLAIFDRRNMAFIEYLHEKSFRFDPRDYQVLCESQSLEWRFKTLVRGDPWTKLQNQRPHQWTDLIHHVVVRTTKSHLGEYSNATILYASRGEAKHGFLESAALPAMGHKQEVAMGGDAYVEQVG